MHKAKLQALGDSSEKETNPCSHGAYILMGEKDNETTEMQSMVGSVGVKQKNEGK